MLKGKLGRSDERKEYLRQHPVAKVCEQQMQRGDYIQPTCRNITLNANYLDKYNFVFNYQNVPSEVQRALYAAYGVARHAYFEHNQEKTQGEQNQDGQLTIGVQFARDLQAVNVSIAAPRFTSQFQNVRMAQKAIPFFVYHPRYNTYELFAQKLFHSQPLGNYLLSLVLFTVLM